MLPVGTYDPVLDSTNYGMAIFTYGVGGDLTGGSDGGTSPPIPCLSDAACAGGGP